MISLPLCKLIVPCCSGHKLLSKFTKVVLPLPLRPTMATLCFAGQAVLGELVLFQRRSFCIIPGLARYILGPY